MEEDIIIISNLNDFVFCPASIYFHKLYGCMDKMIYQGEKQLNGSAAHYNVDAAKYSSRKDVLTGIDVYSEKYNILGKIDVYDKQAKKLMERKKHVSTIYEGYIFQVYAQYHALVEMGYEVHSICIHSMDDNKNYRISLPEVDTDMQHKFEKLLNEMRQFDLDKFVQNNATKCEKCIYEPICDRSVK